MAKPFLRLKQISKAGQFFLGLHLAILIQIGNFLTYPFATTIFYTIFNAKTYTYFITDSKNKNLSCVKYTFY